MQTFEFVAAMLALRAYQDGFDDGLDCMRAVAFTIRNRARAGWWNGDYTEILNHHQDYSAYREPPRSDFPDPRIYSVQTLLQEINDILSGRTKDNVTIAQDSVFNTFNMGPKPAPALYYARLDKITNEKFYEISRDGVNHPRIAQVGMTVFFS